MNNKNKRRQRRFYKLPERKEGGGGEKSDKQKMRKQNSSDCLAVQDWKLEDLRQGTVYPERSATQNTCPQSDHQSHRTVKENTFLGMPGEYEFLNQRHKPINRRLGPKKLELHLRSPGC